MSPPLDPSPNSFRAIWGRHATEFGIAIAILAVIGFTIWLDPTKQYLVRPAYNFTEIIRHASILGIFALGAGIVIVSGGIDLSSGSVIALSAAVCCSVILALCPVDDGGNPITRDVPFWILGVAILATVLVALMIGSFHAWLITVIRLPPFIATLASLVGLRSLARLLVIDVNRTFTPAANTQIYIRDEMFKKLGQEWYYPLAIFLIIAFLLYVLMSRTVVGRHLYAIGGNEDAARLSGIRTERLKWLAYCIGTVTASIAGVLYSGYIGASTPQLQGLGYELNAIAASVVGGCSLAGGIGTIPGIMLGALFLRVVIDSVAKVVKGDSDIFQGLIVGVLVVLAVTFNELRARGAGRKEFLPGALGYVSIAVLTVLATTVAIVMAPVDSKTFWGALVGCAVFAILVIRKYFEVAALKKSH